MNKLFLGGGLNVKCQSTVLHHDYQKFKILLKQEKILCDPANAT